MSEPAGFYFYDLETSGRDPRWHRILQFAGVRTDAQLNPLEDPLVLRGRLPEEVLPEVEAMVVTGLAPATVTHGLGEAELAERIFSATGDASMCLTGYNSVRFDDEFLRFSYYRSLLEPYARERRGGSRFDLLDLARATRALRPEGMQWPTDDDGLPSTRLTSLAAANGIEHLAAHDAASDVLATVGLAQRLRASQPRLFDYAVSLRVRRTLESMLTPGKEPIVHVSGRIPRERRCLALMSSLARHPRNARGYIVFDLDQDPREFEQLDEDELHRRIFTANDQLAVERLRIKEIRTNKAPFVAELVAVRKEDADRLHLDIDAAIARHRWLRARPEFVRRMVRAFSRDTFVHQDVDADAALYDNLINDREQLLAAQLRADPSAPPGQPFADARLNTLWTRFRARNWPDLQTAEERHAWTQWVCARLRGEVGGAVSISHFVDELQRVRVRDGDSPLLSEWAGYGRALAARLELPWPDPLPLAGSIDQAAGMGPAPTRVETP